MAKAKPRKGIIGLFPVFMRAAMLRILYAVRIGGWSPFGLLPPLDETAWPTDLWAGDVERGKHIANRRFTLSGCDISFSRHIGWYSREGSVQWLRALHGFGWIRDLVAYNSQKNGVKLLRHFVEDWMYASERPHNIAREAEVMGERLANWITYGRLLQLNAPTPFRRRLLHMMVRQALTLRMLLRARDVQAGLASIKAVLLASLCLLQCGFMYKDALAALHRELEKISGDSLHPPLRNPIHLHRTLRHLIDIRTALQQFLQRQDATLDAAILNLGQLLAHVLHQDGGFALFNGAVEGEPADMAQTLAQARQTSAASPHADRAARQTTPTAMMERSGYARLEAQHTDVLIDVGVPDYTSSDAYYGTLSFEMSHGSQRLVVNCGTFIGNDPAWSRVVKTTAAHSTVCVDDRNSCQFHGNILPNAMLEHNGSPTVQRRIADREGYLFFEGEHNGYVPYAGLVHTRQLLLSPDGTRFSGADHLYLAEGFNNARSHDVNLRFHLHPSLHVRRLMNGMVVLTPQDGQVEWTFHSSVGQAVELEEGIYLGIDGKPVSTTQIVIYAPFAPGEKWALEWSFIKN